MPTAICHKQERNHTNDASYATKLSQNTQQALQWILILTAEGKMKHGSGCMHSHGSITPQAESSAMRQYSRSRYQMEECIVHRHDCQLRTSTFLLEKTYSLHRCNTCTDMLLKKSTGKQRLNTNKLVVVVASRRRRKALLWKPNPVPPLQSRICFP